MGSNRDAMRYGQEARARLRRTVVAVALAVLALSPALWTSGCRATSATAGPDIRGRITAVSATPPSADANVRGWVDVVGGKEADSAYDRAHVAITRKTRILQSAGATRRALNMAGLRVGQRVEIRFTGPVAESYPVQATAREITVLPE